MLPPLRVSTLMLGPKRRESSDIVLVLAAGRELLDCRTVLGAVEPERCELLEISFCKPLLPVDLPPVDGLPEDGLEEFAEFFWASPDFRDVLRDSI